MLDNTSLSFYRSEEQELSNQFIQKGYVCVPVENRQLLDQLRSTVVNLTAEYLNQPYPDDPDIFLNQTAEYVTPQQLNGLRLKVINGLLSTPWFRIAYFHLARSVLESLVGNELAMQRGVGLSVQLPKDSSSLLNMHSDSWSGDSPFEVVVWLPLVNCFKTKSMYLFPPPAAQKLHQEFANMTNKTNQQILDEWAGEFQYLEVPYGHLLVFNHNLPHGNTVNDEAETRWSINCRFKSIFSPYADKKLGEFFEPITLKSASRIGLAYQLPVVE